MLHVVIMMPDDKERMGCETKEARLEERVRAEVYTEWARMQMRDAAHLMSVAANPPGDKVHGDIQLRCSVFIERILRAQDVYAAAILRLSSIPAIPTDDADQE